MNEDTDAPVTDIIFVQDLDECPKNYKVVSVFSKTVPSDMALYYVRMFVDLRVCVHEGHTLRCSLSRECN